MGVSFWVLFGVAVGGLASLLTPGRRSPAGVALMLGLGTLGALLGGLAGRALGLYQRVSQTGALIMAALGAVVLVALYNAIFARRQVY